MINPETYYTVQGWMVSELGLKGNALAVYAIIYGFSQDGNSEYQGSARYLAEWLGCSRSTVMLVLKKLVEDGYLKKRDIYQNGVAYCTYTSIRHPVQNSDTPCPKFGHPLSENQTPPVRNSDTPCPKTGHNITRDNYRDIDRDNNRDIEAAQNAPEPPAPEKPKKQEPVRHKHGEYKNVLLTDEQLADLRSLFPYDLQTRIERLSEYMASTGRSYKNHFATIKAWARKDQQDGFRANRTGKPGNIGPNGITIDPTKTDMDGAFR